MAEVSFRVLGVRHAELAIPERPHDFGVTSIAAPLTLTHEIGGHGAPRWRITVDGAADHDWQVETLPEGRLLVPREAAPEDLEWSYLTWADGSRGENGFAALLALPPGRYRLVRSSGEPERRDRILLGNTWGRRPPTVECLLDDGDPYALAWSADAGPPRYDRPLVGLVTPDSTGYGGPRSALFLDCIASPGSGRSSGDIVLVIPVTAPLAISSTCLWETRPWNESDATDMATALTARYGI